jgi:hypothetical protein
MDKSIDIYLYFIIGLFGIMMGIVVVTQMRKSFKMKISNGMRMFYVAIMSILISVAVYFIFDAIYKKNAERINLKNIKLLSETDSINKMQQEQKEAYEEKARRIRIMNLTQKYFDASESKNIERYDSLFVFPVKKFFVITNVSRDKVNERIRFAWKHNPALTFKVTNENTHVDDYVDSVIVLVNLNINKRDKNVIARIKFDKNFKIYSLNNFIQSEKSTQKILSPKDSLN